MKHLYKMLWLLAIAWATTAPLQAQQVIFEDDFESQTLKPQWTARPNIDGGENGIIDIQTSGNDGNSFLRIGKSSHNGGLTTNALDLRLNLAGRTQVELDFDILDFFDENHPEDGIYFSDNGGSSFVKVFDFKPEFWCDNNWYSYPEFDVDKLAAKNNLVLNNQFVIRFQQRDNADFNTSGDEDGFYLDNIYVGVPGNIYVTLPIGDGFNNGVLPNHWKFAIADQTTNDPNSLSPSAIERVRESNGNFWIDLGNGCDGVFGTAAVDLFLNLENQTEVEMTFDILDFYEENHSTDGIYFSDDGGENFTKVFGFNPESWCDNTWGQYAPFDIDKLARENDLSLSSTFVIRFQQYDNANFNTSGDEDGLFIDNVVVKELSVVYANLPFEDDFDSGEMKSSWSWAQAIESVTDTTTIIPSGRFGLSSNSNRNNFWASMGKQCDGSFATNALDLHLNLEDKEQIELSFSVNDFFDENHDLRWSIFQ